MRKLQVLLALILVIAFVAACGETAPPVAPEPEVEVEETVEPDPVVEEEEEYEEEEDEEEPEDMGEVLFGQLPGTLPRNETLFVGGWQWGAPIGNNPFAINANNGLVIAMDVFGGRVLVYETLYMFNVLTGELIPLLASGQPEWNDDMSVLTVNFNPDSHFNNGAAVTARDLAVTFDTMIYVGLGVGLEYAQFINEIVAVDTHTAEIHLNMENFNPMRILEFVARVYVLSADDIEARMEYHGGDIEAFRGDPWHEPIHSGPYTPIFLSSQMTVLERDDNYWGQADSMWGSLPAPRYIAANIYGSNDALRASFAAGQIDVNQQFITNVWELWESGLPISTFLDEAPYYLPGSMPSIWFNTTREGLDNRYVRQAIAFAIDYEQIIAAAMSGYSPTFDEAPRSIAMPLEGEQAFVDNAALAHLQWANRDIDRANALLDEMGIIDHSGNGIREYPPGNDLSFTLMCPMGWNDWEASLEIVAAAGAAIGINLTTNFVEAVVWTEAQQVGDFDILMASMSGSAISSPWNRAFHALYVEDSDADRVFWGFHRMYNSEINELILRAGAETDMNVLREYYTEISRFMLEEMPVVALMYRPTVFHTVNESVWTGFPEYGDGTNVPPWMLAQGYGVAGLYNIVPVNP